MNTYVTWPDLVQVGILVVEVIGLFVLILQIKKK